jgi:hypothetical protein
MSHRRSVNGSLTKRRYKEDAGRASTRPAPGSHWVRDGRKAAGRLMPVLPLSPHSAAAPAFSNPTARDGAAASAGRRVAALPIGCRSCNAPRPSAGWIVLDTTGPIRARFERIVARAGPGDIAPHGLCPTGASHGGVNDATLTKVARVLGNRRKRPLRNTGRAVGAPPSRRPLGPAGRGSRGKGRIAEKHAEKA